MDIEKLIDAAAAAAVESAGTSSDDELAAVVNHGKEARLHVWDAHYANKTERVRLAEKLAASSPEFQLAVAATERILADELAESRARIERIRAENPNLYKDYQ